jgi:hypothetical protein
MRELPSIDALQTLQTRQRRPYLYQATEDAAWTSTGWTTYASTWRVKVKKVKMDGTLDTIELTKDCIGAETDPLPIASGDYCIETVTADGLRALVLAYDKIPKPFELRVDGNDLKMFVPATQFEGTPGLGMVTLNGKDVSPDPALSLVSGWNTIAASTLQSWYYVAVVPLTTGGNASRDPSNADDCVWTIATTGNPKSVIGYNYSEDQQPEQYQTGTINLDRIYTDTDAYAQLGSPALRHQRSLEAWSESDGTGSIQIYGFDSPGSVLAIKTARFLAREESGSVARVTYPTYENLLAAIEDDFLENWQDYLDALFEDSFADAFTAQFLLAQHNDLDGLQGGVAAIVDPATPGEYYHLSEAEYEAAQNLASFAEETVYVITALSEDDPPVPTYSQRIILTKAVP